MPDEKHSHADRCRVPQTGPHRANTWAGRAMWSTHDEEAERDNEDSSALLLHSTPSAWMGPKAYQSNRTGAATHDAAMAFAKEEAIKQLPTFKADSATSWEKWAGVITDQVDKRPAWHGILEWCQAQGKAAIEVSESDPNGNGSNADAVPKKKRLKRS